MDLPDNVYKTTFDSKNKMHAQAAQHFTDLVNREYDNMKTFDTNYKKNNKLPGKLLTGSSNVLLDKWTIGGAWIPTLDTRTISSAQSGHQLMVYQRLMSRFCVA